MAPMDVYRTRSGAVRTSAGSTPAQCSRNPVRNIQVTSRPIAMTPPARTNHGMADPLALVRSDSHDLHTGLERARMLSPADAVTVADHVLTSQRCAVEDQTVTAQAGDAPLAVGAGEPG